MISHSPKWSAPLQCTHIFCLAIHFPILLQGKETPCPKDFSPDSILPNRSWAHTSMAPKVPVSTISAIYHCTVIYLSVTTTKSFLCDSKQDPKQLLAHRRAQKQFCWKECNDSRAAGSKSTIWKEKESHSGSDKWGSSTGGPLLRAPGGAHGGDGHHLALSISSYAGSAVHWDCPHEQWGPRKVLNFISWVSGCLGKKKDGQCQVPQKSWTQRRMPSSVIPTGQNHKSNLQSDLDFWCFVSTWQTHKITALFLCFKYFLRSKHVKHPIFLWLCLLFLFK